jgi:Mn-containing catalase
MYLHTELLINEIASDEPDPAAANALQEGLGGQFGEMRTMMQYLFQSINFRGDPTSKPYKDLLQGVGTVAGVLRHHGDPGPRGSAGAARRHR